MLTNHTKYSPLQICLTFLYNSERVSRATCCAEEKSYINDGKEESLSPDWVRGDGTPSSLSLRQMMHILACRLLLSCIAQDAGATRLYLTRTSGWHKQVRLDLICIMPTRCRIFFLSSDREILSSLPVKISTTHEVFNFALVT